MSRVFEDRLSVGKEAASAGGKEALNRFRTNITSENKTNESSRIVNPAEVVTAADREAQRRVIEIIREEYPDDAIVGEEEDELKTVPKSGFSWIIDPIDGTYNYARGNAYWATSIAIVRDGEPIAGINVLPVLEDMYVGSPDGVTRNGESVRVSSRPEPKFFSVAPIVIPDYGNREQFAEATREIVTRFGNFRRYGSAQVTFSLLASGVLEGAVTARKLNPWDSIAGVYMIEQAGGTVTDLSGNPWTHDSQGLVASNGESHGDLLDIADMMKKST